MLALIALSLPAFAAEVYVPWSVVQAMLPPDTEKPEKPPGPMLSERSVRVKQIDESIQVEARWTIRTEETGWLELPLPDPSFWAVSATWKGKPLALRGMRDGSRRMLVEVDGDGELVLIGELPGELRRGVRLLLPAAAVGRVEVVTEDPDIEVTGDGVPAVPLRGALWTGAKELTISTQREVGEKVRPDVIVASAGLGLTVGDGSAQVKGRLRWAVQRGALETVRFRATGAGQDLEVTGARVQSWNRAGDVVTVQLVGREEESVAVDVRWSSALPDTDEARLPLPQLTPLDVFRATYAVQIARDGDREIVPALNTWTAIPHRRLPEVAGGLVEGTPVSSWTTSVPGTSSLSLFRFQPVAGPPTIVDVASWEGRFTTEGRLLLRGQLSVRNDRGSFLTLDLPHGTRLMSVLVDGKPARVGRDGETFLVPLIKSLETVQGLLSFPITVVLLQQSVPFEKKEERQWVLPRLGAEVAATRASVTLPANYTNRIELGERGTVASFSEGEGLSYGLSSNQSVAEADQYYRDALSSWMSNDFRGAQDKLDALRSLGGENENVRRLQSNIDVVEGKGGGGDVAMANRVKEQALARGRKQEEQQRRVSEEAAAAYAAGDYETAERSYQQAIEIGSSLQQLETGGAVEWKSNNEAIAGKLAKAKSLKAKKKAQAPAQSQQKAPASPPPHLTPSPRPTPAPPSVDTSSTVIIGGDSMPVGQTYASETVIDFEDLDISGELVKPDGALMFENDNAPAPLQVTASVFDVVIPTHGETVRYQRLLTRAGEPVALTVLAKRRRDR